MVEIKSNKDLLRFLEQIAKTTEQYLKGSDELFNSLPKHEVYLLKDLEINEVIADRLSRSLAYFSGTFEGNNHKLNVSTNKPVSIFSSVYYAKISNLIIHNVKGSKGLMIAHDSLGVELNNVKVTGNLKLQDSMGALFKTAMNNKYNHCSVSLNTRSLGKLKIITDDESHYMLFGGYVGTDLGGSVYNHCKISGDINSEVMVGGFAGISKGSKFINCSVAELKIRGLREVGLLVGRVDKEIIIESTSIEDSSVTANIYSGFMAGRSEGKIECVDTHVDNSTISSDTASSFVGGIAGTSGEIKLVDCHINGNVYGNFVLAGVCPDACTTHIEDCTFDILVTAAGYKAMMTHAYPLVREEYLTTRGNEPSLTVINSDVNIKVTELEMSGLINPFKEAIV